MGGGRRRSPAEAAGQHSCVVFLVSAGPLVSETCSVPLVGSKRHGIGSLLKESGNQRVLSPPCLPGV